MNIDNAKLIPFLRATKYKLINWDRQFDAGRPRLHIGICVASSYAERPGVSYKEQPVTEEREFLLALVKAEFGQRRSMYLFELDSGGTARRIKLLDKWIKQAELRQDKERFEKARVSLHENASGFMCNALGGNPDYEDVDEVGVRCVARLQAYKPDRTPPAAAWYDSARLDLKLRRLRIAILNLCLEDIEHELAAS